MTTGTVQAVIQGLYLSGDGRLLYQELIKGLKWPLLFSKMTRVYLGPNDHSGKIESSYRIRTPKDTYTLKIRAQSRQARYRFQKLGEKPLFVNNPKKMAIVLLAIVE